MLDALNTAAHSARLGINRKMEEMKMKKIFSNICMLALMTVAGVTFVSDRAGLKVEAREDGLYLVNIGTLIIVR